MSGRTMTGLDEVNNSSTPAVLRAEIVRMEMEHAAEVARLLEDLAALREQEKARRDVDVVTEQVALQQEVDNLRERLREKGRILDVTSAQCRRLEDELEDQRLAYDGLKQDLERKKSSLAEAREQVARLSKERQDVEGRYRTLLGQGQSPPQVAGVGDESVRQPLVPRSAGASAHPFIGGLTVGAILAGAISVLALRPELLPFMRLPLTSIDTAAAVPDATLAAAASPAFPLAETGAADAVGSADPPQALRTVRDRLRDGSLGPLMVAIEGGQFTMGRQMALPNDDRGPAHEVELAGFLIGATEVTYEQYDRFVRSTGGRLPNDFDWGRGRRPVVDVSWNDAEAYTRWLASETGRRYRLPSEAEWEYVATAGRRSPYWWGFEVKGNRAVCFDCGSLWDNRSTAPVATFEPNPLGLYDTAGNAMEWVADCYYPSYVGAPADGSAWIGDECRYRVARGGAFNKPAGSMVSTKRHHFEPKTRLNIIGFRVVRDG